MIFNKLFSDIIKYKIVLKITISLKMILKFTIEYILSMYFEIKNVVFIQNIQSFLGAQKPLHRY
jgi:hypothetical protein